MHTVGCMRLSKPIQGRSGPSEQQFLHNDLLQWAWKLPQPAAFITHQPQQTAFCFILSFHPFPFLLAPIREPSAQPFSGHSEPWLTSPIQSARGRRGTRFLAALNVKWCLHCVFRPPLGHHRQISFPRTVNDDWKCSVIDRLGQPLPLSEPLDKFCHCQKIWGRLMTLDICSPGVAMAQLC